MELMENWMEIYNRSWQNKNIEALTRIFKSAPPYLRNTCENRKGELLELIFNKENGLLTFLESTLNLQVSELQIFCNSVIECFHTIEFIIEYFFSYFEPYIVITKETCLRCLGICNLSQIQIAASLTLKKLIKFYQCSDLKFNASSIILIEKKSLYIIFAAIVKYCPKPMLINDSNITRNNSVNLIFYSLLHDLKFECNLNERNQKEEHIIMYLECLSNMMTNFELFKIDLEKNYFNQLYKILLSLCKLSQEISNRIAYFTTTYIKYFVLLIYEDYKTWHNLFNTIHTNNPSTITVEALRIFYKCIFQHLLKNYNEDIFLYFDNYLMANFVNIRIPPTSLSLTIYGLGQLFTVHCKYLPLDKNELFQMIALRTLPFSSKKEKIINNIEILPDCLQALSEIMIHSSNISSYEINIIIKLSIFIFNKLPELNLVNQKRVINSFKATFLNIRKLEKNLQYKYFYSLLFEGMKKSCSHALFVDTSLQCQIENVLATISYKSYLPFWHSLLEKDNYSDEFRHYMFHKLILTFISIIDKLNLNVTTQQNNFLSETSLSLVADKEKDFLYFTNVVDLYLEIFGKVEVALFHYQLEKLLIYLIKCSYRDLRISGFYKLIYIIFKKADIYCSNESCFDKCTIDLILQYLSDIIQIIFNSSDELQLCCICLIFKAPLIFAAKIVDEVIPVFKVAFKIGLNNFSLAFLALETLEYWLLNLHTPSLNKLSKDIIFLMEPYFTSNQNVLDMYENMMKVENIVIQNSHLLKDDINLYELQTKFLTFYNFLNQDVLLNLIHKKTLATHSSWNKKELLTFKLCFHDKYLEIILDNFIPNIMNSIQSENRRTKFSACELLYTYMTIILGKKLVDQYFTEDMCFTVLKLGCDSDSAVRNLFHPFVIQFTHFLSSTSMIESKAYDQFICVIFDGLTDEWNTDLRDYCSVCLKELVLWQIKQSQESERLNSSNFSKLVDKIINFALRPSKNKCVAAAIAFNSLYIIFSKSKSIINMHWLEFLYVFIKSLEHYDEYDDIQILSALHNVETVIKDEVNILNGNNSYRRKHFEFSNETLKGATKWLFGQCSSLHFQCRNRCRDLFERICILVPGFKSVKEFINSNEINEINSIGLKHLNGNLHCFNINSAKAFLGSLDFYTWIFKNKFLSPEPVLMFKNAQGQNNMFLKYFNKVVSIIITQNIEEVESSATTFKEENKLVDLINKIILKIVSFMTTVLNIIDTDSTEIHEKLWTDDMYILIYNFVLYPRKIGLTTKNLQLINSYIPETWLFDITERLPDIYNTKLKNKFSLEENDDYTNFINIYNIVNNNSKIQTFNDFVKGLIMLRKCNLFYIKDEKQHTISHLIENVKRVAISNTDDSTKELSTYIIDYIEHVISLFLLDYQPSLIEILLNFILNDSLFKTEKKATTVQKDNIIEMIKKEIYQFMIIKPGETLDTIEKVLHESPNQFFLFIEDILSCALRNTIENSENFANEIIKRWKVYNLFLFGNEFCRRSFFEINRISVEIINATAVIPNAPDISSSLYYWILEELNKIKNVEEKLTLIESFLMYIMIDESSKSNLDLLLIFENLREKNSVKWLKKLETNEMERFWAIQAFQVLVQMLMVTGSDVVYESIIKYAAGACNILFEDNIIENLNVYFNEMPDDCVLKSLNTTYDIFKNMNLQIEERYDILQWFLLPSLESCETSTFVRFVEQNFENLFMCVSQEIQTGSHKVESSHFLVTKIGCYRIFELVLGKSEISKLSNFVSNSKEIFNTLLTKKYFKTSGFCIEFDKQIELMRLLHCAALNCYIAAVCLNGSYEFCHDAFNKWPESNQFIWEKIIDCEKIYNFSRARGNFNFSKKRTINIRKTMEDEQSTLESPFASFFRQKRDNGSTGDVRQSLSFEEDVLNDHECMTTIVGLIIHLYNNKIIRLPDLDEEIEEIELPKWLLHFFTAFYTGKDNVNLFLMRIIANTKEVFIRYLRFLFVPVMGSVCLYVSRNPLNYLIRDMIFIFIEKAYKLKRESEEALIAQDLLEVLIQKAENDFEKVYEYNLELIEKLVFLWNENLRIPNNLSSKIVSSPKLALKIILILFKNAVMCVELTANCEVNALVRNKMFNWQESSTVEVYETIGWIIRHSSDDDRDNLIKENLLDLFVDMQRYNRATCIHFIYMIFLGYRCLVKREELWKFINPRMAENDESKIECYEMFLEKTKHLQANEICEILNSLDLLQLLRDRVLPYVEIGFKIINSLVNILEVQSFLPYLRIVKMYANVNTLLKYKKMAYSIFIKVYSKFFNGPFQSINEHITSKRVLMRLCNEVLISGVGDASNEIQDDLICFWKENANLPENIVDRLLCLLNMFTLEVHSSFAQFLCFLTLDLTDRSPNNNKNLYTSSFLSSYEDYTIIVPRISRRKKIKAPLFAPSLTSVLDKVIIQQGSGVLKSLPSGQAKESPNTCTTLDALDGLICPRLIISSKRIPDPSENVLSKRFLSSDLRMSEAFISDSQFSLTSLDEYYEQIKEDLYKESNNVRVSRKYRYGNYPDVEISQDSVVKTLYDFARRNKQFASDFIVSVICTLMRCLNNTNREFTDVVMKVSCKALEKPNDFAPSAMQILYQYGYKNINAVHVMRIAKSMKLQSLGILLLEKNFINSDELIQKRKISSSIASVLHQHPLELAELYRSIGDVDVIKSIFTNWLPTTNNLRKGCVAEINKDWITAKTFYKEVYDVVENPEKEYCLEGLFRCLNQLSSWSDINSKNDEILNKDHSSIWRNPEKNILLPWILKAQLQQFLGDISNGEIPNFDCLNSVGEWLHKYRKVISEKFGEELSVFYLFSEKSSDMKSMQCLDNSLQILRECWIHTSSFIEESRLHVLNKLRVLSDIRNFLLAMKSTNYASAVGSMTNYWAQHLPQFGDDLLSWNTRIGYRLGFASLFIKRLKQTTVHTEFSILEEKILLASLNERLKISDLALKYRNNVVAKTHIKQIERSLNEHNQNTDTFMKLSHEFSLIASRYKFLCAEMQEDPEKKIIYYRDSWQLIDNLIENENVNLSAKFEAKHHVFVLTSNLYNLIQGHREYINYVVKDDFFFKILALETEEIEDSLSDCSLKMLQNMCLEGNSEEMAESYETFIIYCHKLISDDCGRNIDLFEQFVSGVLIAMSFGSLKAARYFPCLLKYTMYQHNNEVEQLLDKWIDKSQNVPSWMFLPWQEQIVLHLITKLFPFVISIIERLVEDYPNKIMYSFKRTYDLYAELREKPKLIALHDKLFMNLRLYQYVKALEYLCQPEQFLSYHLMKLIESSNNLDVLINNIDSLLKKIFSSEEVQLQGSLHKKIFIQYRFELENLKTASNFDFAKAEVNKIYIDLNKSMLERINKSKPLITRLECYSSYLSNFLAEDLNIEIPGQCTGRNKPMALYHTKIQRVSEYVEIVNSTTSYIKITLIGTNGQTYDFLTKFGFDMRREQRMQQIFEFLNEILDNDVKCHRRRLTIHTYNILPLTKYLGLIRLTYGTKSLRDFVEFSTTNKTILQNVSLEYQNYINSAGSKSISLNYNYKQALVKHSVKEVIEKMKVLTNSIDCYLFRKTFLQISSSADCFLQLRRNFISSYATMCTVHWITGIGDRRLEKTWIEIQSGTCIGIDFDLVFGAGIDLPVPELVPFRLTTQILGLLKPFNVQDEFGEIMNSVLGYLRGEKHLILAYLNVILYEPLEWNEKLNSKWKVVNETHKGIKWLPKKKYTIVEKKLSGVKPSNIMFQELSYVHDNDDDEFQYFNSYKYVIDGNELHHRTTRSYIRNDDLTPKEQVQCLLDQATDANVLGRLWHEWLPFV